MGEGTTHFLLRVTGVRGRRGGANSSAEHAGAVAIGANADGGCSCKSACVGVSAVAENVWLFAAKTVLTLVASAVDSF